MKRLASILIILLTLFALIPTVTYAAGEVFIATNNLMLPLTDAMPIKSGGVWYVDYKSFTSGDLKVHSAHNEEKKTLVLYTWDTNLIFNMENSTAYTTDEMIAHKQWCFAHSGTLYVPAEFTAKMLGFEYSFLEDIPLIRIKSDTNVPDNVYYYIAQSNKKNFLDAYYASKNNQGTSPPNNEPPVRPPETPREPSSSAEEPKSPEIRKIVYLTFTINSGAKNKEILDILSQYNIKATFFLQGSTLLENDDSIRRMMATGHSLGLCGYNGNSDFNSDAETMLVEISKSNDLLYKIARIKTRLIRVPSGSKSTLGKAHTDALINAGYRFWDWNVNSKGTYNNPSASTIINVTVNALKTRNAPAILLLNDDANTVSALPRILNHIKDNNYIIRIISVLDSPVNQLNDKR